MLKGHVFKEQVFGNQIFALFINTFLNGQNGISTDYKNGMEITYSGNTLTIQSGAVCVQGRLLEEDTSTDIAAGTDNAYCKLVLEIDLDKENTETEFVQASYKIIKGTNSYPELTQTNIVKNNTGVYQYELARFRTTSNGITDFQDMRTFLEFNSIYAEIIKMFQDLKTDLQADYTEALERLQQELTNVEDGSAYILNSLKSSTYAINETSESLHGGTAEGSLTLRKQGKVVMGGLSLRVSKAGKIKIIINEEGLRDYTWIGAKSIVDTIIAINETGKGIQSTTPAGIGSITIVETGYIEIDIYTTQDNCCFNKLFTYQG